VGNAHKKGDAAAFRGSSEREEKGPAVDHGQKLTRKEESPTESLIKVCKARRSPFILESVSARIF
jgi:hypothetical protein